MKSTIIESLITNDCIKTGNFKLKNGIFVNFSATTRSNFNYQVSIDVLENKSRTKIEKRRDFQP